MNKWNIKSHTLQKVLVKNKQSKSFIVNYLKKKERYEIILTIILNTERGLTVVMRWHSIGYYGTIINFSICLQLLSRKCYSAISKLNYALFVTLI